MTKRTRGFALLGGEVYVSDRRDGTTRPTWIAELSAGVNGEIVRAAGDGKAAHVALARAGRELCDRVAERHRRAVRRA